MSAQSVYDTDEFNDEQFNQDIIYYCILYLLQGINMFVLTIIAVGPQLKRAFILKFIVYVPFP